MRYYRPALRILFPYVFKPDKTGHILVAFNRDYKYIPRGVFHFARKPHTFEGVWHHNYGKDLYMYSDDPSSRTDYFDRLDKLLSHKHDILQDKTVSIKSMDDIICYLNISQGTKDIDYVDHSTK